MGEEEIMHLKSYKEAGIPIIYKQRKELEDNCSRKYLYLIVNEKWIEMFFFFLTVLSCIQLMIEKPSNTKIMKLVLNSLNMIYSVFFTIEALMKMWAFGLYCPPREITTPIE